MKKEKEEEGMGKEERDPRKDNGGEEEVRGEGEEVRHMTGKQ